MNSTEIIDPLVYVPTTETAIAAPPTPGRTMLDFRKGIMEMSIPMMQQYLAEYTDWRKAFREWLLSIMTEGVHYGWAVGFAPKWCDASGRDCPEDKATHTKTSGKNGVKVIPLSEWTPKRNLLLAGADLVCDALWVSDKYESDMETWQQLGSKPGIIVKRCKLYSKITGEFIGEGSGGRENGEKFMGLNASIKMAENSAKRCAVLNAYGLRDLFTQDMEDEKPLHENPAEAPGAPKTQPRDDRVTKEEVAALVSRWKVMQAEGNATPENWKQYVCGVTNAIFPVGKYTEWTADYVRLVNEAIREDFGN